MTDLRIIRDDWNFRDKNDSRIIKRLKIHYWKKIMECWWHISVGVPQSRFGIKRHSSFLFIGFAGDKYAGNRIKLFSLIYLRDLRISDYLENGNNFVFLCDQIYIQNYVNLFLKYSTVFEKIWVFNQNKFLAGQRLWNFHHKNANTRLSSRLTFIPVNIVLQQSTEISWIEFQENLRTVTKVDNWK